MKKLVLFALILVPALAFAGENTCLDSSGNFTAPSCTASGGISTAPPIKTIDAMTAVGTWAALGNDTTGVETDLDSPMGGGSVEYDKVNGAANTVFGAVTKTLSSVNLSGFGATDRLQWNIYMSAISNVSYTFVRLGTSASHYNEWRVPVAQLTTGWQTVSVQIGSPTGNTGNGWDNDDIDYVVIGTAHSAESDTLADVRINNLVAVGGSSTGAITSVVPGTGAASLGKAEDAAAASGDTIVAVGAIRSDTLGTAGYIAGTAGDYMALQTDARGALYVNLAGGSTTAGASAPIIVEDGGRTDGEFLVKTGAVRDDALVAAQEVGTDLDWAPFRSDNYGALWTHPLTKTTTLTDTAVIEAAAYASGDCIMASAEVMTGDANVDPFLSARITDIVITDLAAQAANIDVVFFNADPGAVCAAINAATDIADDDLAKVIGIVPVTTHFALNDNSVSTATNVNIKYNLAADTGLYYALISRGTPTYGGTSDLVVSVKVELD